MKKASLFIILSLFLVCLLLGAFVVFRNLEAEPLFAQNGFILTDEVYTDADGTFARGYEFLSGTQYNTKFPERISFDDRDGNRIYSDLNGFVHYEDGSVSSLSNAVLMNLDDLGSSLVNYYNITPATPIERAGGSYMIQQPSGEVMLDSFIMKLAGGKLLIAAPSIELYTTNGAPQEYGGYLEVNYIDDSVTSIVHESGALLTVAPECYATVGTARIDLAAKRVVRTDTNDVMYIEQMVVGADDNIDLVDNANILGFKIPQIKLPEIEIKTPTFVAVDGENGEDGEDGENGVNGEAGRAGADGAVGKPGDDGASGDIGKDGTQGTEGRSGESGEDGVDGQTGVNGRSGTAGSNGETVGGDGLDDEDSAVDSSTANIPTVKMTPSSFAVSPAGGLTMDIKVTDGDGQLDVNGTIKITESSTGRVVYSAAVLLDADKTVTVTAEDIAEYNLDTYNTASFKLIEGAEYQLTIESDFNYASVDYHRVFLAKLFRPNTAGIDLYFQSAGTDWLTFAVQKNKESTVDRFTVQLSTGSGTPVTVFYISTGGQTNPATHTVVFDAEGLATFTFEYDSVFGSPALTSDTLYLAQITALHFEDEGSADAAGPGIQYGTPVEGRTLKALPTIGGINIILGGNGFSLQAAKVSDAASIKSYRYEIYLGSVADNDLTKTVPEKPIAVVESASLTPVSVPLNTPLAPDNGILTRSSFYRARVVGTFRDNAKDIEIEMLRTDAEVTTHTKLSEEFGITALTMPTLEYAEGVQTANTITGTIYVTPTGGAVISTDTGGFAAFTVALYNSSGSPVTVGNWPQVIPAREEAHAGGDKPAYALPINQEDLNQNSVYMLTVTALVDLDGAGTAYLPEKMVIGSVNARTLQHPPLIAQMSLGTQSTGNAMNVDVKILPLAAGLAAWDDGTISAAEKQNELTAAKAEVGQIEKLEFYLYYSNLAETIAKLQAVPSYQFAGTAERNAFFNGSPGLLADGLIVSCGTTLYRYYPTYTNDKGEVEIGVWRIFTANDDIYIKNYVDGGIKNYQAGDALFLYDSMTFDPNKPVMTDTFNFESVFTADFIDNVYNLSEKSFNKDSSYFEQWEDQTFTIVLAYGYDYAGNRIPFYNNYAAFNLAPAIPEIPEKPEQIVTADAFTNAGNDLLNAGFGDRETKYIPEIAESMNMNSSVLKGRLDETTLAGYTVNADTLKLKNNIKSLTYSMYKLNDFVDTASPRAVALDALSIGNNAAHVADFVFNSVGLISDNGVIPKLSVVLTGGTTMTGDRNLPSGQVGTASRDTYYLKAENSFPQRIEVGSREGYYRAYVKAARGEQYFFTVTVTYLLGPAGAEYDYTLPDQDPVYGLNGTPGSANLLMRSLRLDAPRQAARFAFYPGKVVSDNTSGYQPYINYTLADLDGALADGGKLESVAIGANKITLNMSSPNALVETDVFLPIGLLGESTDNTVTSSANWFMQMNGMDPVMDIYQKFYSGKTSPDDGLESKELFQRGFEALASDAQKGTNTYYKTKFPDSGVTFKVESEEVANRFVIQVEGLVNDQLWRVAGLEVTINHDWEDNDTPGDRTLVLAAEKISAGNPITAYIPFDMLGEDNEINSQYQFTVNVLYDEGNWGFSSAQTENGSNYYAFQVFGKDLVHTLNGVDPGNTVESPYLAPSRLTGVNSSTKHSLANSGIAAGSVYSLTAEWDGNANKPKSIAWENKLTVYGGGDAARRQGTFTVSDKGGIDNEGLKVTGAWSGYLTLKQLKKAGVNADGNGNTLPKRGALMPELWNTQIQTGPTTGTLTFMIKNRSGLRTVDGDKMELYVVLWGCDGPASSSSENDASGNKMTAPDSVASAYNYYGKATTPGEPTDYAIDATGKFLKLDKLNDEQEFTITFGDTGQDEDKLWPGKQYWVSFYAVYDKNGTMTAIPLYDPVRQEQVSITSPVKYRFITAAAVKIDGPDGDKEPMHYEPKNYRDRSVQLNFKSDTSTGYFYVYTLKVTKAADGGLPENQEITHQQLLEMGLISTGDVSGGMNKTVNLTFKPGNKFTCDSLDLSAYDFWAPYTEYELTVTASTVRGSLDSAHVLGSRTFTFTAPELNKASFASTVTPSLESGNNYTLTYHINTSDANKVVADVPTGVDSTGSQGAYKVRLFKSDGTPVTTTYDALIFNEGAPVSEFVFDDSTVPGKLSPDTTYELRVYAVSNIGNDETPTPYADVTQFDAAAFAWDNQTYVIHRKAVATTNVNGVAVGTITASAASDNRITLTFNNSARLTSVNEIYYTVTDNTGHNADMSIGKYTDRLSVNSASFTEVSPGTYEYTLPAAVTAGAGIYEITLSFSAGGVSVGGNYSVRYAAK
ncbi:MAG: hypothetical protein LBK23_10350 [Oscillospiraceae bacterium]|jgi:hypothetical protein|nr:hypothetical protein [Oscillospiraceae bacterium]